ncbi:MAG: Rrf2 family transcriptional regulator [Hydrogenothermaceae bacterium]|nr:Rrf2 family transcriptional regulator [Hydrogenothermaceae bacterium]
MISEATKDSIRALVYIALYGNGREYVSIKEISRELGLSFYFLSKNMLKLVKVGILQSFRGPKGGVSLKKKPGEIKLIDVVASIDGLSLFENCLLGFRECRDEKPCIIHKSWVEEREKLYKMFNVSLEQLIKEIESGKQGNILL